MGRVIYVTHPEVEIDPDVEITSWDLSEVGRGRAEALAARWALPSCEVYSSTERKALETAWPVARKLGVMVDMRLQLHENDRSSTGYLPREEFETVADVFFANPSVSVRGWETAENAQSRVVNELEHILEDCQTENLLICGHGAVGTLMWCALMGKPISREWDQKQGGSWFEFDRETRKPTAHWAPLETLFQD